MHEFCVDLELAKELKDNGFPQDSYWKWIWDEYVQTHFTQPECLDDIDTLICDAPTSDDILKELPSYLKDKNQYYVLKIEREFYNIKSNKMFYEVSYAGYKNIYIEDDKLPNALAIMYLYLKKNGYIK